MRGGKREGNDGKNRFSIFPKAIIPKPLHLCPEMGKPAVELLVDAKAVTGEGPSWDERKGVLYWVDIPKGELHVYDPSRKRDRTLKLGGFVTSVVPYAKGSDVAVTLQHGFYRLDPKTAKSSKLAEVELDMADNRFNDGKCDTRGRYWAGTMGIGERRPSGSLYRLDGERALKVRSDVTVSNGLGWSPDDSTMYYIDSPVRKVVAFRYDIEKGTIRGGRTVADFASQKGVPDGMAVDREGMIWVAHWGGFRVSRWNPNTGKVLSHIPVPAPNVASCCFGGKNLDELYITTATSGLSPAVLRRYPHSGGLFRVRTEVNGLPTNYFQP